MNGFGQTKQRRGFTLVEMLLVLIVVGVISALAIPNFSRSFARTELQGTADDITFLMRYAQSRAVTKQVIIFLFFDLTAKQYWLEEEIPDENTASEHSDGRKIEGRFGRKQHIPEGMALEISGARIAFTPDGDIGQAKVQVCLEEDCLTISSLEQRGYIQVFEEEENNP